jgi:flagellar biosynthesis protein FlhF
MEMRTFEGFDLKSALKSVKNEFGNDAVILKTQERFDSETGRKVYEVTATSQNQHRPFDGAMRSTDFNLGFGEKLESIENRLTMMGEYLPKRSHLLGIESGIDEVRKLLADSLQARNDQAIKDIPACLGNIYKRLTLASVDKTAIKKLIDHLKQHFTNATPVEDQVNATAMKWMLKHISVSERWNPKKGFVQLQCFLGLGGVGKTSLVAKVAAAARKKHKTLIAAYANGRVGGNEQLKLFARIYDCRFLEFDTPVELSEFLHTHSEYELVLIDTDTFGFKDREAVQKIKKLRDLNLPIGMNLVLSVNEREEVTENCIKMFSEVGVDTLNFARVEDTWACGEIFNRASRWQIPIGYLSVGPRVPEDIERANKEKIVQRILGF